MNAVLLPTPGDPFLINLWMKYFRVWGAEAGVDALYVGINTPLSQAISNEVSEIIQRVCDDIGVKAHIYVTDHMIDHGRQILELLQHVPNDATILLIEDDCMVRKGGHVRQWFKSIGIDKVRVVGSPRNSCSPELSEQIHNVFPRPRSMTEEGGENFWPNMLFISKLDLAAAGENYGGRVWAQGEVIPELKYWACPTIQASDTFVEASIRIRERVPARQIIFIPSYHGHPNDVVDYYQDKGLLKSDPVYCHIGSLSSGVGGVLRYDAELESNKPNTSMERMEWERRVQWWEAALAHYEPLPEYHAINEFIIEYRHALETLTRYYKLSRANIKQRRRIYSKFFQYA